MYNLFYKDGGGAPGKIQLFSATNTLYKRCTSVDPGETPNLMMLGCEVELPLDLMIEAVPQDGESETAYVEALRQRMHEAWDRARVVLKLSAR